MLAVAVALVVILSLFGPLAPLWLHRSPALTPSEVPIRHVVIVMMENHPFDNLFGTYCSLSGPFCPGPADSIPPGTCVPYDPNQLAQGCVRPFPFAAKNLTVPDLPHSWASTVASINGGAMNGFYAAERGGSEPFGHYNGSTIPLYWDLAEEYALGDNFFSSALSYSLPNHWYLLAGQAPSQAGNASTLSTLGARHAYLDAANQTQTVADSLNATPAVTWKYYDWSLPTYQTAINSVPGTGNDSAYSFWNPLAAKHESYLGWYSSHFVPRAQLFRDAAGGQLPNVSWVIPDLTFSDHPPVNLSLGEQFVASAVDAIESSPEWYSTAVILTWDDYGGFYDHVPPPRIDSLGLSFRVPLLVISPYTPAGEVVHSLGYFESLLRFVEWKFGLPCITYRDCNAPLPLDYFDFQQAPRPPIMFPSNITATSYPMPLQGLGAELSGSISSFSPHDSYTWAPLRWNTGPPPADLEETDLD